MKYSGSTVAGSPNQTVTVISKTGGWLTVDPTNMSRKNAFEKKPKGDCHKISFMSPSWMHNSAQRDEDKFKMFMPRTLNANSGRGEPNRVILADRE